MSGAGWAIVAGLVFLAGFGGFGIGDWGRAKVLDAVHEEGQEAVRDEIVDRLLEGYEPNLVPTPDGWSFIWWRDDEDVRDLPSPDLAGAAVDAVDRRALPSAVPAGAAGALRDDELDVPRPGLSSETAARSFPTSADRNVPGPGRLPSQDTYRAELAKLAGPDPAPWLAALIAPEPPVQPGPPPELAWLERLLYKGAMSTAWCTSVIESLVPSFAEDVAATDRAIARWGEEARWELIGRRQWPLPGMVTA